MNFLGVDIGGTAVKIGLVNDNGDVVYQNSYNVNFDNYKTPIIQTVKKSIALFLQKNNVNIKDLSGIGVSATGQIDVNTGTVIGSGGNIKNWNNTNIKKQLEDKFKLKTTVINDANAVALGEFWIGNGKGYSNIIAITIGTGIGGGIIINSNLLNGSMGIAGELGHFSINCNGNRCSCGNLGCYETYGSMTALVNSIKNNQKLLNELNMKQNQINGKVIFDLIENEKVNLIVESWIDHIAEGLVSLTHIFNPEIILIGGGVSNQDYFINKVRLKVLEKIMPNFGKNLKIKQAKLNNTAGLVGGVYYLINAKI